MNGKLEMKMAAVLPEAFVAKLAWQGLGFLLLPLDAFIDSAGDDRALYGWPGLHWRRDSEESISALGGGCRRPCIQLWL